MPANHKQVDDDVDEPLHYDPEVLKTNYLLDFPAYPGHHPPKLDRKPHVIVNAKFEGQSMSASDYQQYPEYRQRESFKPKKKTGDSVPFEGQSSYSSEFVPRGNAKREMMKPKVGNIELAGKFEGESTSKASFVFNGAQPYIDKAQPFKPARSTLGGTSEDRDFHTENSLRFIEQPYSKTKDFKPERKPFSSGKFQGSTTSSQDYIAWQAAPPIPFKPKNEFNRDVEDSRDFATESHSSFVPQGRGAKTFKPPVQSHAATSKFEGEATSKADFIAYGPVPTRKPFLPARGGIGSQTDSRDWQTESGLQFVARPYSVVPSCKKVVQYRKSEDNRDWSTENKTNLIDVGYAKREPFLPAKGSVTAGDGFYASTTYGNDFYTHPYAKQEMMKPQQNFHGGQKDDRTFATNTNESYQNFGPQPVVQPFKPKRGKRVI
jgi:hypothetical protein